MKANLKPPSIAEISERSDMSVLEISDFLDLVKRSMEPYSKRISVVENEVMRYYAVERRGVGVLETQYGNFWLYNFEIDDQWGKYSVIV